MTLKAKSPAFQFYPSDWLSDEKVACLTIEEEGAYIRLLSYCWREGSIPADTQSLCRLAKGCHADAIENVKKLFEPHGSLPGRLESKRLNKEIAKQENYRKTQSASGLRGAAKRWGNHSDPIATPMAKNGSVSSSSSVSVQEESLLDSDSKFTPSQFPPPLNTPEFKSAWTDWKKHRSEKKKPLTPMSIKRQIRMLVEMGEHGAIACIDTSIRNGWTGLFEPKGATNQPAQNNDGGKSFDQLCAEWKPS